MLRPAKLVDSRLSRPEPGGCSCELVRLSDCLVQVVGGRKKSGLGKYGRKEGFASRLKRNITHLGGFAGPRNKTTSLPVHSVEKTFKVKA